MYRVTFSNNQSVNVHFKNNNKHGRLNSWSSLISLGLTSSYPLSCSLSPTSLLPYEQEPLLMASFFWFNLRYLEFSSSGCSMNAPSRPLSSSFHAIFILIFLPLFHRLSVILASYSWLERCVLRMDMNGFLIQLFIFKLLFQKTYCYQVIEKSDITKSSNSPGSNMLSSPWTLVLQVLR